MISRRAPGRPGLSSRRLTVALGARRRRRSGGAALVEAVVALPLFVMLLAALLQVTRLYLGKLHAFGDARDRAWAHALSGCESATRQAHTVRDGSAAALLASQGAALPAQSSGYVAAAGGEELSDSLAGARGSATVSLGAAPLLGRSGSRLSAELELPCNERPRAGSPIDALGYGWSQVRFW